MYKKRYMVVDAAAAFQYIRFHFQLHIFSTTAARESGSRQGGSPRSQDKLPPVQTVRFEHQSLPQTMSIMQSAYTWRERERIKEENTSKYRRFIWDSRQLTWLSLTYHCCSARRRMAGEIAVHHPEYNQHSTWLEELMDVSTGRAIWWMGKWMGSSCKMGLCVIVILHKRDTTVKGCNVYGQRRH